MNRKSFISWVVALLAAPLAAWGRITAKPLEVEQEKQEDRIENHNVFLFATPIGFKFRKIVTQKVTEGKMRGTYSWCEDFSPYFAESKDAAQWLGKNHPKIDLRYEQKL